MSVEAALPPVRESFWKRRLVRPIVNQLRQGVTPDQLALTIALAIVLAIFPILGSTTLLCGVAAWWLRLNQPIIHLVSNVAYPAQLALLIPTYRAGEWIFGTPRVTLSIPLLFQRFGEDWRKFFHDYGQLALQGIAFWLVYAPFLAAALYFGLRPLLRRLARRSA
jgi:uncharacterized protein (DUF2062 family)